MAPTEVLAEQHFLSATRQLDATPVENHPENIVRADGRGADLNSITIALLTGSLRKSVKSRVQGMITNGEVDIVIGTHALLQDAVSIPRLALVVIDEQHKFGVGQRAALTDRAPRPHLLAMSAHAHTALVGPDGVRRPRTLHAPGRCLAAANRSRPNGRNRRRTAATPTPLLEKRSPPDGRCSSCVRLLRSRIRVKGRAATVEFERLRGGELAGIDVGLLHGRMSLAEKQAAMDSFRDGGTQALVATPVIEVGVDVSNATVMLIESADRFGMAPAPPASRASRTRGESQLLRPCWQTIQAATGRPGFRPSSESVTGSSLPRSIWRRVAPASTSAQDRAAGRSSRWPTWGIETC